MVCFQGALTVAYFLYVGFNATQKTDQKTSNIVQVIEFATLFIKNCILPVTMDNLAISDVTLSFGGLKALSDVSLEIEPGLITSIIGPNGAGKTSLLNCISGFYHPTSGDIFYGDHKLNKASPHQVSNMGIARAFQNIELFGGMTVLDNLMLARHQKLHYSVLHAMVYFGKASREESKNRQYVEEIIDFHGAGAVS